MRTEWKQGKNTIYKMLFPRCIAKPKVFLCKNITGDNGLCFISHEPFKKIKISPGTRIISMEFILIHNFSLTSSDKTILKYANRKKVNNSKKAILFRFNTIWRSKAELPLHEKCNFPIRIYSENVTKYAISSGFGRIYWRNLQWKNPFFVQCANWKGIT